MVVGSRITLGGSLSARRAWIEMMDDVEPSKTRRVALRKESVDRNEQLALKMMKNTESLSARRAWIEMFIIKSISYLGCCRSPQGERG